MSLSVLCVIADYWLKRASESAHPIRNYAFASGVGLYAISAFGWVFVFRHFMLATVNAFFSLIVVISLAVTGVVAFRESLSTSECIGLLCAAAALVLLGRFKRVGMAPGSESIYIAKSRLGRGVFAGRDFQAGEPLFRFSGPLISLTQAIEKGETEGNVLQIGAETYVDLASARRFCK